MRVQKMMGPFMACSQDTGDKVHRELVDGLVPRQRQTAMWRLRDHRVDSVALTVKRWSKPERQTDKGPQMEVTGWLGVRGEEQEVRPSESSPATR